MVYEIFNSTGTSLNLMRPKLHSLYEPSCCLLHTIPRSLSCSFISSHINTRVTLWLWSCDGWRKKSASYTQDLDMALDQLSCMWAEHTRISEHPDWSITLCFDSGFVLPFLAGRWGGSNRFAIHFKSSPENKPGPGNLKRVCQVSTQLPSQWCIDDRKQLSKSCFFLPFEERKDK